MKAFNLSKNANHNYCASIAKINGMEKLENSDHLYKTIVDGFSMIVSDDIKEGEIVVYIPVETVICKEYLSANNLYSIGEYRNNKNYEEVEKLLIQAKLETDAGKESTLLTQAKSKVGFFEKRGRVKILKLRGEYSQGFIASVKTLEIYNPELKGTDWEQLVGTQFDEILGNKFCWKYIPPLEIKSDKQGKKSQYFFKKRMNRLARFMEEEAKAPVPDDFAFHYDTENINRNINLLKPSDIVTITVKVDGTSAIFGNLKAEKVHGIIGNILKKIGLGIRYRKIFSSRKVIKNKDINPSVGSGYYQEDIWTIVGDTISPYLDKGMTVYGEIVGYVDGTSTFIQMNHDYGCKVGEWKFMPYRIVTIQPDGKKKEWNVVDVYKWTEHLIACHPEIKSKIMPIKILYHGRLDELYPDLDIHVHWHENLLERLKNDKNFLMEEKEPLCHIFEKEANMAKEKLEEAIAKKAPAKEINKLKQTFDKYEKMRPPREGIVIRIDNDVFPRAWKLKTMAHLSKECKSHDNGQVDIEELG